ncbi:MAG TPA: hypothetical protein VGE74_15980, partial [Gemmata sp.]
MLHFRLVFVWFLALGAAPLVRGVEPWTDNTLPVTDGVALWLDASRVEAAYQANNEKLPANGALATWFDGSGKGRHLKQPVAKAQPAVAKFGRGAVVRFDGTDDALRSTGGKDELKVFT